MPINYLIFWLILIFQLSFSFSLAVYLLSLIFSSLMGSPYVPTKNQQINLFLQAANLKKGQLVYDLGCGDGRIVRQAAIQYQVKGVGFDVNILLLFYARLMAKLQHLSQVDFVRQNLLTVDLHQADVVYIFLMPSLIKKLVAKFKQEMKKNSLLISHGFAVEGLEDKLIRIIQQKPFPTYFYRL